MTENRRDFLRALGLAGLAGGAAAQAAPTAGEPGAAAPAAKPAPPRFPAAWRGSETIAMLLYPEFTALDLIGPQYMLGGLLGAKVHLVAASREPVRSDTGVVFLPSMTLEECPADLDLLFVPGGAAGTVKAMNDAALVRWIAARGQRSKLLASVCTGAILLGQAGLLKGRRATTHWATHALLADFGATPVDERVVWDGRLVTGAGVSAGIDLGLSIVARLRDPLYAQCLQLQAEYAPQPMFNAGTPRTAPPEAFALMNGLFEGLRANMRQAGQHAL